MWCFFRKFGSKPLKGQDDNLRLAQQALCTICLADQARRLHCTVKLGNDNSPSSLMDHMRIHHQDEYNAVVVANSKGLSLAAFTAQRKEPRVRTLLGNYSVRERRSAIGLFMLLSRHHSLTVVTSLKTLKARICSDARSHLKWCHHLTLCLKKTWSMSPSLPRRSETPIF